MLVGDADICTHNGIDLLLTFVMNTIELYSSKCFTGLFRERSKIQKYKLDVLERQDKSSGFRSGWPNTAFCRLQRRAELSNSQLLNVD